MPNSLTSLLAQDLPQVTSLPRLPVQQLNILDIAWTGITSLPEQLSQLRALNCSYSRIQHLPALPSCETLDLRQCRQLPANLLQLNCFGCTALRQLPEQLPAGLRVLQVGKCTSLEQLPELPPSLVTPSCSGCSSLQQLPDVSRCRVQNLSLHGCVALTRMRVGGCDVCLH
jgi:Leucine-rich repeat (LRR) protein